MIDVERIKRVFINILMNAIKFSPKRSTIHIRQWVDENYCKISIKDQGIGMSPKLSKIIFDRNTEAAREGTENESPVGIGLSIAKSIIEAHGGTIWAENRTPDGALFGFRLPTCQPDH